MPEARLCPMEKKVIILATRGEPSAFAHAIMYTLDLYANGYDTKMVIEMSATKAIDQLVKGTPPFKQMYSSMKEKGLVECVCEMCAKMTGSLDAAQEEGLPICAEMDGHPSLTRFIEAGYQIITM